MVGLPSAFSEVQRGQVKEETIEPAELYPLVEGYFK